MNKLEDLLRKVEELSKEIKEIKSEFIKFKSQCVLREPEGILLSVSSINIGNQTIWSTHISGKDSTPISHSQWMDDKNTYAGFLLSLLFGLRQCLVLDKAYEKLTISSENIFIQNVLQGSGLKSSSELRDDIYDLLFRFKNVETILDEENEARKILLEIKKEMG